MTTDAPMRSGVALDWLDAFLQRYVAAWNSHVRRATGAPGLRAHRPPSGLPGRGLPRVSRRHAVAPARRFRRDGALAAARPDAAARVADRAGHGRDAARRDAAAAAVAR